MKRRHTTNSNPDLAAKAEPAGSPPPGEPAFLAIGKLRRPHGVHGEMLMDILTDFPERLRRGSKLYVGEQHQMLKLRSARWNGETLLVSFSGFNTPEEVGVFRNEILYVATAEQPPLPEGEYYQYQLLGLTVIRDNGQVLGVIHQILETGANDVYVVLPENGEEILLPAIEPVILKIDMEKKEMIVHLLPGLVDDIEEA